MKHNLLRPKQHGVYNLTQISSIARVALGQRSKIAVTGVNRPITTRNQLS
jgi:hypothetical protein